MKCEICQTEIPREKNSVVCSDKCQEIRLVIFRLCDKYFPTNGCDNCWGDLHQGCSGQCKKEFSEALVFGQDVWKLIRIIFNSTKYVKRRKR